jgi:esterase/lipase
VSRRGTVPIVVLLAAVLAAAPCTGTPLATRHRPTGGPASPWKAPDGTDVPFREYVARVERLVPNRVNAPHEWPIPARCGGRAATGILLLHGLTDSPFIMRDLGDRLAARAGSCALVRSILLPGHGTAPGDLVDVRYEEWEEAAKYGVRAFGRVVRDVHIVGFSTGAALAIRRALAPAQNAPRVAALILLSPAIRPTGWLAHMKVAPHVLGGLSRLTGVERWLDVHRDDDYAKYESFPTNAGYQIYRLDEALAGTTPKVVPAPMFVALSREDTTVSADDTAEFFRGRANNASRLLIYARDPDEAAVQKWRAAGRGRVTVLRSSLPEQRILDFAHLALAVAPGNPHYGRAPDYVNCLHYDADGTGTAPKFCACVLPAMRAPACGNEADAPAITYGESSRRNVDAGILRRLTYNPLFDDLWRRIEAFLRTVDRD